MLTLNECYYFLPSIITDDSIYTIHVEVYLINISWLLEASFPFPVFRKRCDNDTYKGEWDTFMLLLLLLNQSDYMKKTQISLGIYLELNELQLS